jgi:hypothetical protein
VSEALRLLWVSGYHPHPPDAGLTAYTAGLSEAVAAVPGFTVRGIGLLGGPPLAPPSSVTAATWTVAEGVRRSPERTIASALPSMASTLALPSLRALFASELQRGVDVVVVDHLQSAWVLDALPASGGPAVVYVSHNDEESVRAEVAAQAGWSPRELAVRLDARKIKALERRLLERCSLLTTITDADAGQMARRTRAPVEVVTPGWTGTSVPSRTIDGSVPHRAVLLGNLHWSVKRANTERFLCAADRSYAEAGAEILIIGPAPEDWVREVSRNLKATTFLGWVDDPSELISQSRLGIVAERAGGGFKMKSLDFVLRRLPMAALQGTVAGLPLRSGRDYVEEPDEASLARRSLALMDDLDALNAMQDSSFSACEHMVGWGGAGTRFAAALRAVPDLS